MSSGILTFYLIKIDSLFAFWASRYFSAGTFSLAPKDAKNAQRKKCFSPPPFPWLQLGRILHLIKKNFSEK